MLNLPAIKSISTRIGATIIGQGLVQGTGLVAGVLVVRSFSVDELALYTLAYTILGGLSLVADSGITAGVMSQGGKVWTDQAKLANVLATALAIRRTLATICVSIAVLILAIILYQHGSSPENSLLIIISVVGLFLATLTTAMLEAVLKLHQHIFQIIMIGSGQAVARLGLIFIAATYLPFTFVAIGATAVTQLWMNIVFRNRVKKLLGSGGEFDRKIAIQIWHIVGRTMPANVYVAFSAQITVWLLSLFGTTSSIAQIGALSRLGQIIGVFSIAFSMVISPRFARMNESPRKLRFTFLAIVCFAIVISAIVISTVVTLPNAYLAVLGPKYSGLQNELVLSMASACVSFACGICYSLAAARGWFSPPQFAISLSVLSQASLIYFFDVSTLAGVLHLSIWSQLPPAAFTVLYVIYKTKEV